MCIDKMRYIMIGCALALIALAGCKTPELSMDERISLPESGEMGMNDTTFVKPLSWDVFFQDTLLRGYVDVALRNNHSFRQSMERIAMSRAALQRAKGLLLPDVNLNIGASVNRFGEYTMDGVGNSETNVPSLPKDKHIPDPYRDFGLSLSFQWEADIWGKLTRKKQAAAARWMASVEATRFAQSMLISDLAIQYYELIGLDRRKEVLRNALASARRSHELTRQLKKEGAETQLAVDQFYARVLSIESKLLENDQLIGEKERAIACLLGVFPFEIRRMGFDELRKLPVPLSEGIPANLLTLRPDVRSAEMGLIASKADVIAAKASQRIALSQYHETALNAYTEVLDLYCASQTQTERIRLKEKESLAHQRSVVNAGEMFQLSYTGFLEVLSAEERYLDSELEHIDIVTDLCRKKILLYRALGGGC